MNWDTVFYLIGGAIGFFVILYTVIYLVSIGYELFIKGCKLLLGKVKGWWIS